MATTKKKSVIQEITPKKPRGRPRKHFYAYDAEREKEIAKDYRKRSEKKITLKVYTEEELKRIKIDPRFSELELKKAFVDFYNGEATYSGLCRRLNIQKQTLFKYFALIQYRIQKRDEYLARLAYEEEQKKKPIEEKKLEDFENEQGEQSI